MAHGGRPLWMDTAFFLLRRHPNVFLDISGIPPKMLLKYFPRLEEIAHKTLFGTDWPGPGVREIKKQSGRFLALPLSKKPSSRFCPAPLWRSGRCDFMIQELQFLVLGSQFPVFASN